MWRCTVLKTTSKKCSCLINDLSFNLFNILILWSWITWCFSTFTEIIPDFHSFFQIVQLMNMFLLIIKFFLDSLTCIMITNDSLQSTWQDYLLVYKLRKLVILYLLSFILYLLNFYHILYVRHSVMKPVSVSIFL